MSSGSLLWIGYTFLSAERYWTYFVMLPNRLFILLHLNKRYFIAYCPVGFLNVFVFDVITLPPIPILVLIISANPRWCSAKNTDRTLLFNTQRWKENSLWFFQGQLTLSNKYIKKKPNSAYIHSVGERLQKKRWKGCMSYVKPAAVVAFDALTICIDAGMTHLWSYQSLFTSTDKPNLECF